MLRSAAGGPEWWLSAPLLEKEILEQAAGPCVLARYQIGDALLEVDSNYGPVLDLLRIHWSDCTAPAAWALEGVHIRCSVRVADPPTLARVSFAGSQEADGSALNPARLPYLRAKSHVEMPSAIEGWSLATIAGASRPFMTSCGFEALVDLEQEPLQPTPGFLHRYVLNAAISTQNKILFVHAASVAVNGTGVLLMGPAASGKTTVSFALASRGHPLLGDEIAGVRMGSGELLPIRRTPGVRHGPRAVDVSVRLQKGNWETEILQDGTQRMLVPSGELFPEAQVVPIRLGPAFYLRSLKDRAAVEEIALPANSRTLMGRLADDPIAVNEVTPARRLIRLLALMDLLSRRRCYFLDVGAPEETAELIEQTLEQ